MIHHGKMQDWRIERSGKRVLAFRGRKVGESSTHSHQGYTQNRWDEYRLYVSVRGTYILEHEYSTQWQGESGHIEAVTAATIPALIEDAREEMWEDGPDLPDAVRECIEDAGLQDEMDERIE